ncbi:putative tetratricopeptide repeat protein 25 [Blattamonas nauphoetae]|uniref:Outer dynein arm-docking complex subunit 4 n=1 Tax=Blattamonas nauphoetae TaxID=2049346 RepID=A0ABQ9Y6F6_9EUKA|nr:putative tetratricopeptide repeat protein 25 [Blattamonas nauphoetae]
MYNYDDEEEEAKPLTQKQEHQVLVFHDTAKVHFSKGEWTRCVESCSKALALKKDDEDILLLRARASERLDNHKAALADTDAIIAVNPKNYRALLEKADILFAAGDFEYALVQYHRGMILRPDQNAFRLGVQKSRAAIEESNEQKEIDANTLPVSFASSLPANLDMKTCRDLTSKLMSDKTDASEETDLDVFHVAGNDHLSFPTPAQASLLRASVSQEECPLSQRTTLLLSCDVTQRQSSGQILFESLLNEPRNNQRSRQMDTTHKGIHKIDTTSPMRTSLVSPLTKRFEEEEGQQATSQLKALQPAPKRSSQSPNTNERLTSRTRSARQSGGVTERGVTSRSRSSGRAAQSTTRSTSTGTRGKSQDRQVKKRLLGHLVDDDTFLKEIQQDPAIYQLSEKLKKQPMGRKPKPTPYFPKKEKKEKKKVVTEDDDENAEAGDEIDSLSSSQLRASSKPKEPPPTQTPVPKTVVPKPTPLNDVIKSGIEYLDSRTEFWRQKLPPAEDGMPAATSEYNPTDINDDGGTKRPRPKKQGTMNKSMKKGVTERSFKRESEEDVLEGKTEEEINLTNQIKQDDHLDEEEVTSVLNAISAMMDDFNAEGAVRVGKLLESKFAKKPEDKKKTKKGVIQPPNTNTPTVEFERFESTMKSDLLCRLYLLMGYAYTDMRKFSLASIYLSNVLDIAKSNQLDEMYEDCLAKLGCVWHYLGDYIQSSVMFERLIELCLQHAEAEKGEALPKVFLTCGNDKLEIPTVSVDDVSGETVQKLAPLYHNNAQSHLEANRIGFAEMFSDVAKNFAEKSEDSNLINSVLILRSRVQCAKSDLHKAKKYLLILMDRASSEGDARTVNVALTNLVSILCKENKRIAVRTLQQHAAALEGGTIPENIVEIAKNAVNIKDEEEEE